MSHSNESPCATTVVDTREQGSARVVRIIGDIDLESRDTVLAACALGDHRQLVVDLANVTFMDCTGYGVLLAARRIVEGGGGEFSWSNQTGESARFLEMIAELENHGVAADTSDDSFRIA